MKYYVDLHIHSALSPCADDDMTPNNIVNMAQLKGLDIIAITDHNSAQNLESIMKCAENTNILVIPGMEIETREEVHVACYFPNLESALEMQDIVYSSLPNMKNKPNIFGNQLLIDSLDNVTGVLERMLLFATDISIEDINIKVKRLGGVMIPAHVDRSSYSVIANLGMIPEEINLKHLEISKACNLEFFLSKYPQLSNYKFIRSSDAHNLGDIFEQESIIDLEEKSTACLINYLLAPH